MLYGMALRTCATQILRPSCKFLNPCNVHASQVLTEMKKQVLEAKPKDGAEAPTITNESIATQLYSNCCHL